MNMHYKSTHATHNNYTCTRTRTYEQDSQSKCSAQLLGPLPPVVPGEPVVVLSAVVAAAVVVAVAVVTGAPVLAAPGGGKTKGSIVSERLCCVRHA